MLNFDPLRPAPGRFTGLTQVSGIYLLNILRANGGFDTRFPALVEPFGIKTTMPGVGETGPNKEGSSVFNWITDITWPYNTLSDFPVTLNPLSIANSIFAAVPPPALINLLTGSPEDAIAFLGSNTAGTVWGSAVGEGTSFALPTAAKCPGSCSNWGTLGVLSILGPVTGDAPGGGITGQSVVLDAADPYIPLTTPLRLDALVTNALLKRINSPYLMGTPLADILSPMLKILVNTGYDDVVTPAKLDTVNPNPGAEGKTYAKQGYVAYDRTFAQDPFKPVPFNWFQNPSMTPEERKAVAGDAFTAFNDALAVQAQKPLFGLVVPNPDYNNTPITPPAAQAAPAPAAAVAPTESDIAAEAKAAVADSESAAPAAPSHRGGGPSAASSDSGRGASRDSGNAGG